MFGKKNDAPLGDVEKVVDVRPGDIVILRCTVALSQKMMDTIKEHLKPFEKDGIKFMVLDHTMTLENVLRYEDMVHVEEEPEPEKPTHL